MLFYVILTDYSLHLRRIELVLTEVNIQKESHVINSGTLLI